MKPRILYIYTHLTSFTRKDLYLLQEDFEVVHQDFDYKQKNIQIPWYMLRQAWFLLRQGFQAQAIVINFAGYNSLLPVLFGRILGKPVLIVVCGTEVYKLPSIGYGSFNKRLVGFFTHWSLRLAHHLAPVHRSMVDMPYTYTTCDYPRQGFRYFYPDITTPVTEINNGYEAEIFKPAEAPRIPNSFLTVAALMVPSTFYRKGIDLILEVAALRPDCTFTVVGKSDLLAPERIPGNVRVIPSVPYEELPALYASHEFYFQLSLAEGHPNALCEAMMSGCIPIGSSVASIPEVIADTGFVLPVKDAHLLAEIIDKALQSDKTALAAQARSRIMETYPLSLRKEKFKNLINDLIKK